MNSLPVSAVLPELLLALQSSPQVLLVAPTGAGKSTWLPLQILRQATFSGRILLLEPRRIAARNVAQRLAELLGEEPGGTVGYRMRGESRTGAQTRLEVVTEGILTRMLQQDPMLDGVSLVILDEFHERSLQADLALALLLDVQQGLREDLGVLIMSATLDNAALSARLPQAPVIQSQGRAFPVERRYQPLPPHQRFDEAVAQCAARLLREESGSLLVFLPGVGEIQRVQACLEAIRPDDVDLCPLYGALPLSAQRSALLPAARGRRKVVLATNIAETSLTIEGIRLVIDSALERDARFDPRSGLTRLHTQRISQAAMTQRAGRAGRLEPGICLHLLSKEQAERAVAHGEPEILHSDLAALWLDLLQWGCRDVAQLTWLDAPPQAGLAAAQQLLRQLGVTERSGALTDRGRQVAALGSEPRFAVMLAAAQQGDSAATAALLVAMLEEPLRGCVDLYDSARRRHSGWQRRMQQLQQRMRAGKDQPDEALFARLLAAGFPDRLARRRGNDGRYLLANGSGAMLESHDPLTRHEWLIVPALLQSGNQPDARILQALPVDIAQLIADVPGLVAQQTEVEWDEEKGTLRAWHREQIGQLVLKSRPQARPDEQALHDAMLRWIRRKGLNVLNWTPRAEQLKIRLRCAASWLPEEAWPRVDDVTLLAGLEQWLLPALSGVRDGRDLKQLDMADVLLQMLTWTQRQRLDSALPTHYTVPTGSRLLVRYDEDKPPVLAVRLQEMYGQAQNPCVAEGRVPLVLELLSPAQRPLQITRDLAAFWRGAYRDVQKEMKGRYPRHLWPDDPANTPPTTRVKKFSNPL